MKKLNFEEFGWPVTTAPGETLTVIEESTGRVLAEEVISQETAATFNGWQWAMLDEDELPQGADIGVGGFLIGNKLKKRKGLID